MCELFLDSRWFTLLGFAINAVAFTIFIGRKRKYLWYLCLAFDIILVTTAILFIFIAADTYTPFSNWPLWRRLGSGISLSLYCLAVFTQLVVLVYTSRILTFAPISNK
jgi:hypothetical protein